MRLAACGPRATGEEHPLSIYLLTVSGLHSLADGMQGTMTPAVVTAAVGWAVVVIGPDPGTGVLIVGAVLTLSLAAFVRRTNRAALSPS